MLYCVAFQKTTFLMFYHCIFHTNKYSVSETPFYLPLGLATSESLTDTNSLDPLSRLEVQQLLFQKLFPGHPSPFTSYSFSSAISCQAYEDDWGQYQIELSDRNIDGHLLYQIQVADRQTLYFDCFDRLSNQLTEHINGSFTISVNKYHALRYGLSLSENANFDRPTSRLDCRASE